MTAAHSIFVTELDAGRIRKLGARVPGGASAWPDLRELIEQVDDEAEIVPGHCVAPDVVTMNSTVSFRDELTGSVHRVTVVYPEDVSVAGRCISVLSPVGRALLGRQVGAVSELHIPDGAIRTLRLLEIHYQPEAAGEFTR